MIRILHLITSLDTGGAEVMLSRLLSRIDQARFKNTVVSLVQGGAVEERIRELAVPVFTIGMRRGSPNPIGLVRAWKLLRRERPAILQTWLYHSDLVGLIAGLAAGVPAIAWNLRCSDTGDMYTKGVNGMAFRALARLSPRTQLVIANSQAGKAFHESRGYAPPRWEVVPNGFDTNEFRPRENSGVWLRHELGLSPDNILVGLVARFDPLKDHRNFLLAATRFAKEYPMARYVMVGSGISRSNSELMALVERGGLSDRVAMLGERLDIAKITAGFDIANCTSNSEGFPNVVAEAMACGVPCVATDVGDVAFLLGEAGKIIPPSSPESLVAAWGELVSCDVIQRRELGDRARKRITTQFSLEAVTRRYEDIYQSLVTSSG